MTPEVYFAQGNIQAQLLSCKKMLCELEAENERLKTEIIKKDEAIRSLEEQLRKLSRKATINSSNSS